MNCDKNSQELLSESYPSADEWSCYPFNKFNFNKNVKTIRKTLNKFRKNDEKELYKRLKTETFQVNDKTRQRIIQLNREYYFKKRHQIKQLFTGLILSLPIIIFMLLLINGIIN